MFLQVQANTQKNRQVAEVNRNWSQRPEDLMLLGKKFLRSPSYKLYVEKWQHGEPILEYDRTFVRDFLMAILLVTGGDHKGDVIRNMTGGVPQHDIPNKGGRERGNVSYKYV